MKEKRQPPEDTQKPLPEDKGASIRRGPSPKEETPILRRIWERTKRKKKPLTERVTMKNRIIKETPIPKGKLLTSAWVDVSVLLGTLGFLLWIVTRN